MKQIADVLSVPVQTGGGIRNMATLHDVLESHLDRVVIGTVTIPDLKAYLESRGVAVRPVEATA